MIIIQLLCLSKTINVMKREKSSWLAHDVIKIQGQKVPALTLTLCFTFDKFLVVFWCFGKIQKSKMADPRYNCCSHQTISFFLYFILIQANYFFSFFFYLFLPHTKNHSFIHHFERVTLPAKVFVRDHRITVEAISLFQVTNILSCYGVEFFCVHKYVLSGNKLLGS